MNGQVQVFLHCADLLQHQVIIRPSCMSASLDSHERTQVSGLFGALEHGACRINVGQGSSSGHSIQGMLSASQLLRVQGAAHLQQILIQFLCCTGLQSQS